MRIYQTVIFVIVITITLLIVQQVAYGQLSPEQLERGLDREYSLRTEYYNYLVQHNVTTFDSVKDTEHMSIMDLGRFVEEHMRDCRTGEHDRKVQLMEEAGDRYGDIGDGDHGGELYYYYGDTYQGDEVITFRGDLGDC